LEGIFLFISHCLLSELMVVELAYQMSLVMVVIQYSVEEMSSEPWMLVSVLTHAEHYGRVSAVVILEEKTVSLVSVVVVVLARLVPVVWEVRG
jgi:hypothetical protein